MDAIEAAKQAILEWERSDEALSMSREDYFDYDAVVTEKRARAAIAAYLEATGLERDAERYREWRRAFRDGECGLWNALCEANSDAEHDAAIDSSRGGDHG